VGNRAAMSRGVRDLSGYETFEERLRAAHAELLAQRPEKHPGEFKRERNAVGQTTFVDPDDVRGTLRHGFEITRSLEAPFARAAMLMFVLSEVHPFDDGNGRVARAFMNAELISGGQRRILIPISFRGDYLTGLRTLSRQAHPDVYLAVLDYAQEYTWRIDFSTYDRALAMLTDTGAFEEEDSQSGISAMSAASGDQRPAARLKLPPPKEETAILPRRQLRS
jgi:Fic family protein